jgi:small subunit ribosomal protein S9
MKVKKKKDNTVLKTDVKFKKKRGRPRKIETLKKREVIGEVAKLEKKIKRDYFYAVGRRKTSVARVRLYQNGSGKIIINKKDYQSYFPSLEFQKTVISPRVAVNPDKELDFVIKVSGGGKRGQAESIRHGLARALTVYNPEFRKTLKKLGYLTRDAREKERKKYGLKRARRAPQWQKR